MMIILVLSFILFDVLAISRRYDSSTACVRALV